MSTTQHAEHTISHLRGYGTNPKTFFLDGSLAEDYTKNLFCGGDLTKASFIDY